MGEGEKHPSGPTPLARLERRPQSPGTTGDVPLPHRDPVPRPVQARGHPKRADTPGGAPAGVPNTRPAARRPPRAGAPHLRQGVSGIWHGLPDSSPMSTSTPRLGDEATHLPVRT
jgi:hypothetical protein